MPNPIVKVLSTLNQQRVKYLLMGGQACIFYGGAEFSRDTDVALLAEPENLERLSSAMRGLQAELRTPGLLREVAGRFPAAWSDAARIRPFLGSLDEMTEEEVAASLAEEEARERAADQAYWAPLRKELERIRHERLS